jgi:hypothetical protein
VFRLANALKVCIPAKPPGPAYLKNFKVGFAAHQKAALELATLLGAHKLSANYDGSKWGKLAKEVWMSASKEDQKQLKFALLCQFEEPDE